ncbi:hypothetical protein MMC07_005897 [Pseudocyphellaria aurata]|nr:hypothetical protein [Pseudocyphellaria aurata]
MLHTTIVTTALPSNPPRNNFTQPPNDLNPTDSKNSDNRKETIAENSPLKQSFQELLDAAVKVALSNDFDAAKAAACASATALASSEHSTTVEIAPPAPNENATEEAVGVFALLRNRSTAELDPCASSEDATQTGVSVFASVQTDPLTKLAPAVLGENLSLTPTCSEDPHFFSGLDYANTLLSLEQGSEATHSEITRPCQRNSAHREEPYHVCVDCRDLAARHIHKMTPELMVPKFLAMCNECGLQAVEEWMRILSTSHMQNRNARIGERKI